MVFFFFFFLLGARDALFYIIFLLLFLALWSTVQQAKDNMLSIHQSTLRFPSFFIIIIIVKKGEIQDGWVFKIAFSFCFVDLSITEISKILWLRWLVCKWRRGRIICSALTCKGSHTLFLLLASADPSLYEK